MYSPVTKPPTPFCNFFNNLSCHELPKRGGLMGAQHLLANIVFTLLKLGSTEWTLAVGNAFSDIFPLFVVLPFMSADYYLCQWLKLFVLFMSIIFCLPYPLVCPYIKIDWKWWGKLGGPFDLISNVISHLHFCWNFLICRSTCCTTCFTTDVVTTKVAFHTPFKFSNFIILSSIYKDYYFSI